MYVAINERTNRPDIFYSIQGEGVTNGVPAVFLRLGRCNLNCVWCDSKVLWTKTILMELDNIKYLIDSLVQNTPCKHLVITGGEPLLQKERLKLLLDMFDDWFIEVETNGTINPSEIVEHIDQWNVSPKLENSGNSKTLRENPEALRKFSYMNNVYFKFVVKEKEDINEIITFLGKYEIPSYKVILMPEGVNRDTILEKDWIVDICKQFGFRYGTRLQCLLWGPRSGV